MNTFANPLDHDLEQSQARVLAGQIQEALAPAGLLDGVSVYLKARDGSTFLVVENGEHVTVDYPNCEPTCVEGCIFCLDLEDGKQVFVRDQSSGSVTVKLIGTVLSGFFKALDLETREELLLEELGSNWESLEALYEISTDALRFGDIQEALKRLIARLTALQAGLQSALFIQREALFHPLISTERKLNVLAPEQLGLVEKAVLEMRVILLNEIVQASDPQTCWGKASSLAVAPFSWQGCVGFIVVWCEDGGCKFDSSFSRVLEAITYQASVMLEGDRLHRKVRESELLAQEVEIASSIQETLLLANAPVGLPNLEIAACSIASQQIDGDFHDFFQHPDGTVDILIGDVMGKGVAAALLGAATKSQFLRAVANLALQNGNALPRPKDIVARAASRLSDRLISLDRFVTLCYARFDVAAQTVSFVDCGHTSMIRASKSGDDCAFLRGLDLPVGVLPDYRCEEHSVKCRMGETYLLYSDGVTENRSTTGELFGPERLAECVENWSALGPAILVEQIRREAIRFCGSEKFSDDFTCIAVRIRLRQPGVNPIATRSATFDCTTHSLATFRSWLVECAATVESCFAEEDISRIQLACSEIFTNCVVHIPESLCITPLFVECRIFANHMDVQISQQGPAFDPLAVPSPSFDGSRDRGFGIYIVLRSSDEVNFDRRANGINLTTLSFLRSTKDNPS